MSMNLSGAVDVQNVFPETGSIGTQPDALSLTQSQISNGSHYRKTNARQHTHRTEESPALYVRCLICVPQASHSSLQQATADLA